MCWSEGCRQLKVLVLLQFITDKTGTITYNKMTLQKIVSNSENIELKNSAKLSEPILNTLIHSVLGSMREPFDPMEKAIHNALNDVIPLLIQN